MGILGPILAVLALLALSICGLAWFFRGASGYFLCPREEIVSEPEIPDVLRMQMAYGEEPLPPDDEAFIRQNGLTDDDLGMT